MFGGGGLNPRKMKQMMKQMGIDVDELDADRVVIETPDDDLVFEAPQVTRMDAQGQQTYQIVGEPEAVADAGLGGAAAAVEGDTDESSSDDTASESETDAIPEADVSLDHGIRLSFDDDSWLLVRPSGTEPYIRLYAESDDVDALVETAEGAIGSVVDA